MCMSTGNFPTSLVILLYCSNYKQKQMQFNGYINRTFFKFNLIVNIIKMFMF